MPTVSLGYVDGWADNVATTHIAAAVLRTRLGYEVKLQALATGMALSGVAAGKLDAFLGHWTRVQEESASRYKDKFDILRANVEHAKCGLAVPSFCQASSIDDLKNDNSFRTRIIGIDSGAGIMQAGEKLLRDEDLRGWIIVASSGPGCLAELGRSYSRQQPVVITAWQPHWIFSKYDLKLLNGGEKYFGAEAKVLTIARKDLDKEHPKVKTLLENLVFPSTDLLVEIMLRIQEGTKPEQAAKDWITQHADVVDGWLAK